MAHSDPAQRTAHGTVRPLVVLAALCAVTAPLTLTPAQFVTVTLVGAFFAAMVSMVGRSVSVLAGADTTDALRHTVERAETGAVVAVALAVLVAALGVRGWLVGLTVAVAWLLLRRVADRRTPEAASRPAAVSPLENRSTADLVSGWVASHQLLRSASSPATVAYIAALRQTYLDELERRDPDGVRRWLDTYPDAASDPRAFIADRRRGASWLD